MTNNLTGVLCKFREEAIAVTCDIEGMFHQVGMNREDRDLLRFLRWENGDLNKKPKEYRIYDRTLIWRHIFSCVFKLTP